MHIRLNTSTLKEKTIGLGLMAAYLLLSIPAWAQLETSMQCVVVNQAGNATVTWDQAADPSGVFEQYVLHCYEPSSELVLATFPIPNPTDPANPSFVNTTYDANTTELCYFVVTEGPAGSSGPSSDTLCSIHLTAEPALTPGTVDLNFNSPRIGSQSPPTFAAPPLSVELEEADGSWTEIAAIADNGGMMTTPYTLDECSGDLVFRVLQPNLLSNCNQQSNRAGSTLSDEFDPDPPLITAVQVDYALQEALVEWESSDADDLAGYIIYACNGGFQMAIDTIFDPTATSYLDLNSNVQAYIESYNVAAFDSCFVAGEPDPGAASEFCASSIFLNALSTPCSDLATLDWAGGFNLPGDFAGYEIWMDQESPTGSGNWSGLQMVQSLDGAVNQWIYEGAVFGATYQFHVAAQTTGGGSILSNVRTLEFSYPGAPEFTSLRRATVSDSGAVNVVVDLDPNCIDVHAYTLQRKRAQDEDYFDLQTLEGVAGMTLQFEDISADTDAMSYQYRVQVFNDCGDSVGTSNAATTVHVEGISDYQLLKNTLHWTPYADFPGATASYRIYRKTNNGGTSEVLTQVPATVLTFEDDVSNMLLSPGDFCYIIEATDSNPGPDGAINYALSNAMCLTQEPVIWVPNAMLIGGYNDTFMPVISFADFTNYRLDIINRWGDTMFSTTDVAVGWDGTYNGESAPEGAYGYFITIQDGSGRIFNEQGMMTLLVSD
jgi:gliding motility-associated-like protein